MEGVEKGLKRAGRTLMARDRAGKEARVARVSGLVKWDGPKLWVRQMTSSHPRRKIARGTDTIVCTENEPWGSRAYGQPTPRRTQRERRTTRVCGDAVRWWGGGVVGWWVELESSRGAWGVQRVLLAPPVCKYGTDSWLRWTMVFAHSDQCARARSRSGDLGSSAAVRRTPVPSRSSFSFRRRVLAPARAPALAPAAADPVPKLCVLMYKVRMYRPPRVAHEHTVRDRVRGDRTHDSGAERSG